MQKTINLGVYGLKIIVGQNENGIGAALEASDLKIEAKTSAERKYNSAMDGIEAMIIGHACAGIDIETPAYKQGIESAVEACINNFFC